MSTVGNRWMTVFPMASFVAGYAKTAYPTYIEGSQTVAARRVRVSYVEESFSPSDGGQSENGKVEIKMKTSVKPALRCLGLLRLVTKFSF